jgi:hypothetical protein
MKKIFTLIALLALTIASVAQTHNIIREWKNGTYTERLLTDIDSITFPVFDEDIEPWTEWGAYTTPTGAKSTSCSWEYSLYW